MGGRLGPRGEVRVHIELGDVPTDLLLAAKSHVDNVVREFALASTGAERGVTAELPAQLASLLGAAGTLTDDMAALVLRVPDGGDGP